MILLLNCLLWVLVTYIPDAHAEPISTGYLIATLIIAAASTTAAIVQNNQRIDAANEAKKKAAADAAQRRNDLIEKQAKNRQKQRGTVLGGTQPNSLDQQTSVLTQETTVQSSLLGG